jgi:hypothetical protein
VQRGYPKMLLFLSYNMWLKCATNNDVSLCIPTPGGGPELGLGDQKRVSLASESKELCTHSIGRRYTKFCEIEAVTCFTAWSGLSASYPPAIWYHTFDCTIDDSVGKTNCCCATESGILMSVIVNCGSVHR